MIKFLVALDIIYLFQLNIISIHLEFRRLYFYHEKRIEIVEEEKKAKEFVKYSSKMLFDYEFIWECQCVVRWLRERFSSTMRATFLKSFLHQCQGRVF